MYYVTLYVLFSIIYVLTYRHTHTSSACVRKRLQIERGQEGAGGDVPDVPVSSAHCGQGASC